MNIERLDFELKVQCLIFAAASCHSCLCYCVTCSGAELDTRNIPACVSMDMHHLY